MHDPTVARNFSMPGMTLSAIVGSLEHHAKPMRNAQQKAVILSVGINEAKIFPGNTSPIVSLKEFGRQLLMFSQMAGTLEMQQLYVGPQPVIEVRALANPTGCSIEDSIVEAYDSVIAEVAYKEGVPYISTRGLFSAYELPKVIDEDGRHPNAFGHAILHHAISSSLRLTEAM